MKAQYINMSVSTHKSFIQEPLRFRIVYFSDQKAISSRVWKHLIAFLIFRFVKIMLKMIFDDLEN